MENIEFITTLEKLKRDTIFFLEKISKDFNILSKVGFGANIYKLYEQYNNILKELKIKNLHQFNCLSNRNYNMFSIQNISIDLEILLRDIEFCLDYFKALNSSIYESQPNIQKEGIYFAGQSFDALMFVHKILSEAKQSITLIDGYIDKNILDLISCKKAGVKIKIMTLPTLSNDFKVLAHSFNSQYDGDLSIHLSNQFHDRFLFIDEIDFYHFGASIKDAANRKAFMFSRIEEEVIIDRLKDKFTEYWDNSTVFI